LVRVQNKTRKKKKKKRSARNHTPLGFFFLVGCSGSGVVSKIGFGCVALYAAKKYGFSVRASQQDISKKE
jgi:hypothetical protein